MPKLQSRNLLILIFILGSTLASSCQNPNIFWIGNGTNGLWSNPTNWNPARVPVSTDIVEIGNSNTMTLTESNITILGLVISANGSLVVDDASARINIVNSPVEGIKLRLRGNLTINSGTISITNAATDGILIDDRSTIINRGSLLVNTFGEDGLHVMRNSSVDNFGDLIIDQVNGDTPNFGINAEDGEMTNHSSGQLFVSTCLSPFPTIPMLHIADNFLYEDSGDATFIPRNCN